MCFFGVFKCSVASLSFILPYVIFCYKALLVLDVKGLLISSLSAVIFTVWTAKMDHS